VKAGFVVVSIKKSKGIDNNLKSVAWQGHAPAASDRIVRERTSGLLPLPYEYGSPCKCLCGVREDYRIGQPVFKNNVWEGVENDIKDGKLQVGKTLTRKIAAGYNVVMECRYGVLLSH
jgi:hypothetical protein